MVLQGLSWVHTVITLQQLLSRTRTVLSHPHKQLLLVEELTLWAGAFVSFLDIAYHLF